jgi:hypothetical protein
MIVTIGDKSSLLKVSLGFAGMCWKKNNSSSFFRHYIISLYRLGNGKISSPSGLAL